MSCPFVAQGNRVEGHWRVTLFQRAVPRLWAKVISVFRHLCQVLFSSSCFFWGELPLKVSNMLANGDFFICKVSLVKPIGRADKFAPRYLFLLSGSPLNGQPPKPGPSFLNFLCLLVRKG